MNQSSAAAFIPKLVFAVISLSAFIASAARAPIDTYCTSYNAYVEAQCAPKAAVASEAGEAVAHAYTVKTCRSEAYMTILETDEIARGLCAPLVENDLVTKLDVRKAE